MRINWEPAKENSSSIDAVVGFVRGKSLAWAMDQVWDPHMKKVIRQLRRLPVEVARGRARAWCRRNLVTF